MKEVKRIENPDDKTRIVWLISETQPDWFNIETAREQRSVILSQICAVCRIVNLEE